MEKLEIRAGAGPGGGGDEQEMIRRRSPQVAHPLQGTIKKGICQVKFIAPWRVDCDLRNL